MVFFVQTTPFYFETFFFLQIPARIPFSPVKTFCFFSGENLCRLGEMTSILDELEGEALLNTKRGGGARLPISRLV